MVEEIYLAQGQKMKIGTREYPIIEYVTSKIAHNVPLVDIPMMSDYKWKLSCLNDRLEHPEKYRAMGENVGAKVTRLRKWLDEHKEESDGVGSQPRP